MRIKRFIHLERKLNLMIKIMFSSGTSESRMHCPDRRHLQSKKMSMFPELRAQRAIRSKSSPKQNRQVKTLLDPLMKTRPQEPSSQSASRTVAYTIRRHPIPK